MRFAPLAAALLLGGTAPALASNTGFGVHLELLAQEQVETRLNLVALPYFYFPSGRVGTPQLAHDLLRDFPTATSFARVDPATGRIDSWDNLGGRWLGDDFPLEPAVGIAVSVPGAATTDLTGSHDDAFPGLLLAPRMGLPTNYLVAPPYHSQWSDADDLLLDAFDGVNPLTVTSYRGGVARSRTILPGPTFTGPSFPLVRGEALDLGVLAQTGFLSPYFKRTVGRVKPVAPVVGVTRFVDAHHSEGGTVLDAADGTRADGATWRGASLVGGSPVVAGGYPGQGTVGAFAPGVWWGQVGDALAEASGGAYRVQPGHDRLVVIDQETGAGSAERAGYYAVINKDITASYPDEYPPATLRPIPVPTAQPTRAGIRVTWPPAAEDIGLPLRQNVTGYEVYRAAGAGWEKVGETALAALAFVDPAPPQLHGSRYAIRLVYRFGLRSAALSRSSACVGPCLAGDPVRVGTDRAVSSAPGVARP